MFARLVISRFPISLNCIPSAGAVSQQHQHVKCRFRKSKLADILCEKQVLLVICEGKVQREFQGRTINVAGLRVRQVADCLLIELFPPVRLHIGSIQTQIVKFLIISGRDEFTKWPTRKQTLGLSVSPT